MHDLTPKLVGIAYGVASEYPFIPGGTWEDLRQEALIGAWKGVRDYRPGRGATLETFVRYCARRNVQTALKMANRQKHQPMNDAADVDDLDAVLEGPQDAFSALLARLEAEDALRHVRALGGRRGAVMRLYAAGYGLTEIAERLGVTFKQVDNAINGARRTINERRSAESALRR